MDFRGSCFASNYAKLCYPYRPFKKETARSETAVMAMDRWSSSGGKKEKLVINTQLNAILHHLESARESLTKYILTLLNNLSESY